MEYYLAIKRYKIESVVMMWIKLELVIQSEVSQKEQNKCGINTYIHGIGEPLCRAGIEMQK